MGDLGLIAVFTVDKESIFGGGVPFILCETKEKRDKDAMDLCRIIGATAHEIGESVFVVKR